MKGRILIFILGCAVGGLAGYYGGQPEFRSAAKESLDRNALAVGDWAVQMIRRVKGEPEPVPAAPPEPPPSKPPPDTLEDKLAYMREFVSIRDLKVEADAAGSNQVSVSGKVRNRGTRSLPKVEVIVFLMGAETIAQEFRFDPVGSAPLGAGEARPFTFTAQNVSSLWVKGRFRASVTDITLGP